MKFLAFGTIVTILLLAFLASAQIEDYVIDVAIERDGKSSVKLLISFSQPTERFNLIIFGKIENFNATAAKPISCDVKVDEISAISCLINFQEKESLKLMFDSYDFVKILDKKYYFSADLSSLEPGKEIKRFNGFIRIPEGAALTGDEILPPGKKISSDGRRIIVVWREENISTIQALRFRLAYEQLATISSSTIQPWQFVAVATIAALAPAYLIIRKVRRPKEIILSVLDEFERAVIDVIISAGGRVSQRRVVQQTGLSKAKVSRVVKSLAKRKLITVERFGRTNILKLVKKKFT